MVTVLGPAEPEVRAAAESARQTLSRLGAKPILERLEAAMTQEARRGAASPSHRGARREGPAETTAGEA